MHSPIVDVYASPDTSRYPMQDSRPGWIRYFLSCRALASPTTCRFIPAHGGWSPNDSRLTGNYYSVHSARMKRFLTASTARLVFGKRASSQLDVVGFPDT